MTNLSSNVGRPLLDVGQHPEVEMSAHKPETLLGLLISRLIFQRFLGDYTTLYFDQFTGDTGKLSNVGRLQAVLSDKAYFRFTCRPLFWFPGVGRHRAVLTVGYRQCIMRGRKCYGSRRGLDLNYKIAMMMNWWPRLAQWCHLANDDEACGADPRYS